MTFSPAIADLTPVYYLSDETGAAINFKYLEFSGSSAPDSSYISYLGNILVNPHIKANVQLDPQNTEKTAIDFYTPTVRINNDSINGFATLAKISVKIEQWEIVATNCKINQDIGGLFTETAILKTGNLDVPVKEFNLRADFLYMDKFEMGNLPQI